MRSAAPRPGVYGSSEERHPPGSYRGWFIRENPPALVWLKLRRGRQVRLSKMLRLARVKKILAKYGDNVSLQVYTRA
jgi:hypothetical protein